MPADLSKVPPYYHRYISQVTASHLPEVMDRHRTEFVAALNEIPDGKWDHRYAEGKWSIKEVVQHVIDAERIFCYRALRFARNDGTALPAFDENRFAEYSEASSRTKSDLVEELSFIQSATAKMFASFTPEQLQRQGIASESSFYVEGLGFIVAGHSLHHLKILRERYLGLSR